jgi:hypothetical protein
MRLDNALICLFRLVVVGSIGCGGSTSSKKPVGCPLICALGTFLAMRPFPHPPLDLADQKGELWWEGVLPDDVPKARLLGPPMS